MWRKATLLIFTLLLASCQRSSYRPTGEENEVVFICDGIPDKIGILDTLINDTFYTPHESPLFRITPITYQQFITYISYKNIVIFSFQGSPNEEFYKRIFPSLKTGVFYRTGVFSEGDIVFGIYAPTKDSALKLIRNYGPTIKEKLLENYMKFLEEKEYFLGFDKKLSKKILKNHGFTFKLSPGWIYKVHNPDFFTLYKHYPDRFIFCYTYNQEKPLDPLYFIKLRDSLTTLFYDGDSILKQTVKVDTIGVKDIPAIVLIGAWQNNKNTTGGGFINISFNRKGKFYMLDYGIYYPQIQDKIEYILRGLIIFKSIKFSDEH
jgi:hypothetical protein